MNVQENIACFDPCQSIFQYGKFFCSGSDTGSSSSFKY